MNFYLDELIVQRCIALFILDYYICELEFFKFTLMSDCYFCLLTL